MSNDAKVFAYRLDENDELVTRLFAAEWAVPEGWVDSPTKLFPAKTSKDGLMDLSKDELVTKAQADGLDVPVGGDKYNVIAAMRYPEEGGSPMPGRDKREQEERVNVTGEMPERTTLDEARQNAAKAGGLPVSGFVQEDEPVKLVPADDSPRSIVLKDQPSAGTSEAPAGEGDEDEDDDLNDMTKAELLEEAEKRGVKVSSADTKAEIIEALRA